MIMLTVGFIVLCYVIVYDCRLKSEYCQKTDSEAHEQSCIDFGRRVASQYQSARADTAGNGQCETLPPCGVEIEYQ